VRTNIYRLGFTNEGKLCLGLAGNRWCWLDLVHREGPGGDTIVFQWNPAEPPKDVQEFVSVPNSGRHGYSLKIARWKDGRRAWVDSRGMLHLRCAAPTQPELTLALGNEWLAAWSEPNLFWGNPFFIGDNPPAPAQSIWALLQAFAAPRP
jgi:hypothetical protein